MSQRLTDNASAAIVQGRCTPRAAALFFSFNLLVFSNPLILLLKSRERIHLSADLHLYDEIPEASNAVLKDEASNCKNDNWG